MRHRGCDFMLIIGVIFVRLRSRKTAGITRRYVKIGIDSRTVTQYFPMIGALSALFTFLWIEHLGIHRVFESPWGLGFSMVVVAIAVLQGLKIHK
jgi:hypothetical protein